MAPRKSEKLEVEMGVLKDQLDSVQESIEKNSEATSATREDVARLRGEINGTLPRIDRNLEALSRQVIEHQETVRGYYEKTAVHGEEIRIIFKAMNGKADKSANDEAHSRLWFVIRISLIAIFSSLAVLLIAKSVGSL
ncbi:MAG: hypothetical protein E3J72_12190 [Planctomycetota bacterium]|nr:MAG: hypothetical protein E3J72_12190 [Planctomycetota bacterium]